MYINMLKTGKIIYFLCSQLVSRSIDRNTLEGVELEKTKIKRKEKIPLRSNAFIFFYVPPNSLSRAIVSVETKHFIIATYHSHSPPLKPPAKR